MEQAFAENLILLGGVPGTHVQYLLRLKESDPRPLWDLAGVLQLCGPEVIRDAQQVAADALQAAGPQNFTFSEGAMIGSWELTEPRGQVVGGDAWMGRNLDGQTAFLRLVPPGSGRDAQRASRFVERSNPGLEPPHPSILKIDEADEDFGWLYTATVNFDGNTLAAIRDRGGPFNESSALNLAQRIASSLGIVHDLGVVHGGLNPLAVVVRGQQTFLSDFGVFSGQLDGPVSGCRPGGRLGVLLYAAPGLIQGDGPRGLDGRDDMYALGAVVYAMLCGVRPGDQRAGGDVPWLVEPACSPGLRALLLRLLTPHEDQRYADAGALMADLQRVATGQMPGGPVGSGAVKGRRNETAAPQVALLAEEIRKTSSEASMASLSASQENFVLPAGGYDEAPVEVAPVEVAPVEVTPVVEDEGEYEEDEEGEYEEDEEEEEEEDEEEEEEEDEDGESRLVGARGKATAAALRDRRARMSASSRLASMQRPPEAKKGGGWMYLFVSLVLVVGGIAGAGVLTQPRGAALARETLTDTLRRLEEPGPAYAELLEGLAGAGSALEDDAQAMREVILLEEAIERKALAEREELLGGDASDVALQEFLERVRGLRIEVLVEWDLAQRADTTDVLRWTALGEELLRAGFPSEAREAWSGASRDEVVLAQLAETMAYVRGGVYLVPGEGGELEVVRRDPCYVGRTEVTRAAYRRFYGAWRSSDDPGSWLPASAPKGKDLKPDGWDVSATDATDGAWPAVGVDYFDALSFAKWRLATLADEDSLWAAVRGRLGRRYPWGEVAPGPELGNFGGALPGLAPVGSFPAGAGEGGALDLLGNAAEWTKPASLRPTSAVVFGGGPASDVTDPAGLTREVPLETREERPAA